MSSPYQPYKVLQTILEKVKDRSEESLYVKDSVALTRISIENQERLAEAMVILGAIMQVIVDRQIEVKVEVPPLDKRN